MRKRPTYEKLEQTDKELRKESADRACSEQALQESIGRLRIAYDQSIIYAEQLAEQLNKEMMERKKAVETLKEREAALMAQTHNLGEANTALKVLLKHREEDKAELQERVLSNVKSQVLPYVEALQRTGLSAKQMTYVKIIVSCLNDIISPFMQRLSSRYLGLTPKEIQVAGLIKEGKTTKEIAELWNLSTRAVEFHRDSLRTKLGLKNKKANLRTYLLSFL